MGRSGLGGVQGWIRGAVLPDKPGHVVVGVDVPDSTGDVRRLITSASCFQDRILEPGRGLLVVIGRNSQHAPGRLFHTGQFRTEFKSYGHAPILRGRFRNCYRELSS